MSNQPLQKILSLFNLSPLEITGVPESYSSTVYRLALPGRTTAFLKLPFNRQKLFREREILRRLQGRVPVPMVLDSWEGDDDHAGALLLSELPGTPLSRGASCITPDLAYQIGVLLGQLHSVEAERFWLLEQEPAPGDELSWWKAMKKNFDRFAGDCVKILPPAMFEECCRVFDRLCRDLPPADGPCIVHFDYRIGNILVDDTGHVTGLIDIESSRGGSADQDFTKISYDIWDIFPETKEAFLNGYASIRPLPPWERTLPLYLFVDAFGGLSWCARRNQAGPQHEFYRVNMDRLRGFLKTDRV